MAVVHTFFESRRTGIAKGKNVREVEDGWVRVIPKEFILMLTIGSSYMVVMSVLHVNPNALNVVLQTYVNTKKNHLGK